MYVAMKIKVTFYGYDNITDQLFEDWRYYFKIYFEGCIGIISYITLNDADYLAEAD